jgi:hypothetical protein
MNRSQFVAFGQIVCDVKDRDLFALVDIAKNL